ncbi:MAG: polyphosphate polymerase domain-containing protein [Clostridia bacterium]|nr:polyphosphate polymerase domain-containing protein [Clostridia bacterium]
MRHEIKSRLHPAEAAALRVRLRAVMQRDPYARPDGTYDIHSIYLDTPTRTALNEKQVGMPVRHKYRIRYYNDNRFFFRLERKSKVGQLCDKVGCTLTRPEIDRLMAGDILWMPACDRPLVRELYLKMRTELMQPSVQVHYNREAYVYGPGNVRVTLDSDIRTGLWDTDFLSPNQPRPRTQSDDFVLLEVKFDSYLPEIIRDITCCQCRPMGFSKFEACHSYD